MNDIDRSMVEQSTDDMNTNVTQPARAPVRQQRGMGRRASSAEDPEYFSRLAHQQAPEYLWIGCSDSRVPANQIIGLPPGEVFVHRNIANVVVHSDLNCLSVIQFAVDLLKVKHIMVVGHYGCSGVARGAHGRRVGLADNWLRHVEDVRDKHAACSTNGRWASARHRRLVELNTIEQTVNVCRTTIVNDAWARGQELTVHGWAYGVHDGRVRNLGMMIHATGRRSNRRTSHASQRFARGGAHSAENDVLASDAARLGDIPAIVEGVIKELKHE